MGRARSERLLPPGPPARRPTCSSVRRRNSWDSSSGCSSSSESVQLRPPTSPAIVARRPRPATHKAPRRKRPGSDVWAGTRVCRHSGCAARPPLVAAGGAGWLSPGSTLRGGGNESGVCRAVGGISRLAASEEKATFPGWPRLVAPPVTSSRRGRRDSRASLGGRPRRRADVDLKMAPCRV